MRPLPIMLGNDAATVHTHELIAQRAAEEKAAENEPVGNEANIAPGEKKPAGHEHH